MMEKTGARVPWIRPFTEAILAAMQKGKYFITLSVW